MTVPTVACTNCGKNFTTDELRATSCRYCGTLLAHHARAAQQVAVVNQMLADRNGNGIPDAYEGLVANAQANAMNQAFGVHVFQAGSPPAGGFGAMHPMQPMMHGPIAAAHVHHATRAASKALLVVGILVGLGVLLMVGGAIAAFVLMGGG
jgi:hypothetical protein